MDGMEEATPKQEHSQTSSPDIWYVADADIQELLQSNFKIRYMIKKRNTLINLKTT